MVQYIDKAALVAEIEKRMKEHHSGYLVCLKDILSFIDTLEAEEVDLEKEATEFVQTKEFVKNESPVLAIAKHFFELGLKAK